MKRMLNLVLAAAVAGLFLAGSASAQSAIQTGTANAQIVQALALAEDTELDFGDIIPDPAGDTVTVDRVADTQTCPLSTCTGHARGQWTVTGSDQALDVSITSNPITLSDGGNTMSANIDFPASVTIAGGSATFFTGGALSVGAAQAEGSYSGTYELTVDYQ